MISSWKISRHIQLRELRQHSINMNNVFIAVVGIVPNCWTSYTTNKYENVYQYKIESGPNRINYEVWSINGKLDKHDYLIEAGLKIKQVLTETIIIYDKQTKHRIVYLIDNGISQYYHEKLYRDNMLMGEFYYGLDYRCHDIEHPNYIQYRYTGTYDKSSCRMICHYQHGILQNTEDIKYKLPKPTIIKNKLMLNKSHTLPYYDIELVRTNYKALDFVVPSASS